MSRVCWVPYVPCTVWYIIHTAGDAIPADAFSQNIDMLKIVYMKETENSSAAVSRPDPSSNTVRI